jgi:hypothetical protein
MGWHGNQVGRGAGRTSIACLISNQPNQGSPVGWPPMLRTPSPHTQSGTKHSLSYFALHGPYSRTAITWDWAREGKGEKIQRKKNKERKFKWIPTYHGICTYVHMYNNMSQCMCFCNWVDIIEEKKIWQRGAKRTYLRERMVEGVPNPYQKFT